MRPCPLALAVLLGVFHLLLACNHWVLREEQIVPKLDSPFHMREPKNLAAFLEQIRYSEYVERSYLDLLRKREQIVEHLATLAAAVATSAAAATSTSTSNTSSSNSSSDK